MILDIEYLGINFTVAGEIDKGQTGDYDTEYIPDIYRVRIVILKTINKRNEEVETVVNKNNVFKFYDTVIKDIYGELEYFINQNYDKYIDG